MNRHKLKHTQTRRVIAAALAASSLGVAGCKFLTQGKLNQTPESEVDAIHAMSNHLFGKNVRAYMWGLTTDNLSEFQLLVDLQKRQSGQSTPPAAPPSPSHTGSQTRIVQGSGTVLGLTDSPPQQAGIGTIESTTRRYYQCWYIATTEANVVKVEGQDLVRLFLERARPVASNFVDAEIVLAQLQRDETTKRAVAFSAGVLPTLGCGTLGMLKGRKHAAVGAMMCNLGFAAFNNYNMQFKKGDVTWGSAAAQEQIQKEIKRKVDELQDVNWDVIDAIQRKLNAFDSSPDLVTLRTPVECPRPSQALVKYMGTTSDAEDNTDSVD